MIVKSVHVSSASSTKFVEDYLTAVNMLQEEGLTVEVQYRPIMMHDESSYIVYSVLLIGRK